MRLQLPEENGQWSRQSCTSSPAGAGTWGWPEPASRSGWPSCYWWPPDLASSWVWCSARPETRIHCESSFTIHMETILAAATKGCHLACSYIDSAVWESRSDVKITLVETHLATLLFDVLPLLQCHQLTKHTQFLQHCLLIYKNIPCSSPQVRGQLIILLLTSSCRRYL